jgi:hypothetical protein
VLLDLLVVVAAVAGTMTRRRKLPRVTPGSSERSVQVLVHAPVLVT